MHDYTMCCHAFSCTAMYLPVLTVLIENCGHAKRVLTGYFNTAAEIFLRVYHYNYIYLLMHRTRIFYILRKTIHEFLTDFALKETCFKKTRHHSSRCVSKPRASC